VPVALSLSLYLSKHTKACVSALFLFFVLLGRLGVLEIKIAYDVIFYVLFIVLSDDKHYHHDENSNQNDSYVNDNSDP
jgi:hypothetical protein